jgi:hypothetical protein
MAHPRKSRECDATRCDKDTEADPIDPRAFGLAKAAYAVGETLDLLSIGRTSLYAAVKRGDLRARTAPFKRLMHPKVSSEAEARIALLLIAAVRDRSAANRQTDNNGHLVLTSGGFTILQNGP